MEFEVNINRKHGMILAFALVFLLGSIVVYAYSSTFTGGDPSIMGHSADEVNIFIDGFAGPMTTQYAFDIFFGKTVCEISSAKLKDLGCPAGSYLFRVQRLNPASSLVDDAFCRFFYTNVDNFANPYECYISGQPAPKENQKCGDGTLCTEDDHPPIPGWVCCTGPEDPMNSHICHKGPDGWGFYSQPDPSGDKSCF